MHTPTTERTGSQFTAGEIRAGLARRSHTTIQLARHLHLSRDSVSRRLRGLTPWRVHELELVAAYLQLPLSALLPPAVEEPQQVAS